MTEKTYIVTFFEKKNNKEIGHKRTFTAKNATEACKKAKEGFYLETGHNAFRPIAKQADENNLPTEAEALAERMRDTRQKALAKAFRASYPVKQHHLINSLDAVIGYAGKYTVGEIVEHRGHECKVAAVWHVDGRDGVTIKPTGNYGFEVDLYEEEV